MDRVPASDADWDLELGNLRDRLDKEADEEAIRKVRDGR